MLQAAVRGVVDFSSVRLHDPRWWQRTRILLRQLETDNTAKYLELLHQHNLHTLIVPNLKEEVFSSSVAQAGSAVRSIRSLYFPWELQPEEQAESVDLRQQWIDVWGDPADPEVQRRIQETVEMLKATSVGAK